MRRQMYELAYITDPGGCRTRNEDSLLIRKGQVGEKEFVLLAVADGMGGLEQGEWASYTATVLLDTWWNTQLPAMLKEGELDWPVLCESLFGVLERANRAIGAQAGVGSKRSGTTLSLLFVLAGRCVLLHVGDSRIYLVRRGKLKALTRDQTWCQQEIERGTMTREEAEHHRMRHVLVSALGVEEQFQCQMEELRLQGGDLVLACSDGFYGELDMDVIPSALGRTKDIQGALEGLLSCIKAGRAPDNITAIAMRVDGGGWLK